MNDEATKTKAPRNYSQKLWRSGAKHAGDAWYQRHLDALQAPRAGFEAALVAMLQGWLLYADTHRARFESGIGQDGVLGDHWADIGRGLRGLLNGEAERLDCGLVDGIIGETLEAEGF